MKAKNKPRIDLENRTKLETVIPLDTPLTCPQKTGPPKKLV